MALKVKPVYLKRRIFYGVLIPLVIVSIIGITTFKYMQIKNFQSQLTYNGETLAYLLAVKSEFGVIYDRRDDLSKLANETLKKANVTGVTITSKNSTNENIVLVSLARETEDEPSFLVRHLYSGGNAEKFSHDVGAAAISGDKWESNEAMGSLVASVYYNNDDIGTVSVIISKTKMLNDIASGVIESIFLVLLVYLIAYRVANRITGSVVAPINELVDVATAIGNGDYSARVKESHFEEIRALEKAYNKMASTILENDEQQRANIAMATSELKERNRQLVEAEQKAQSANAAKSQFLANISHEIRTPLNAIIGYSKLIHSDTNNAYTQDADKACDRILGLLEDITTVAQHERNAKRDARESPWDFVLTLSGELAKFNTQCQEKGIEINFIPSGQIRPHIVADKEAVAHVIRAVMGNAVKFTSAGSVTIRSNWGGRNGEDQDIVSITIADTGVGISESNLTRVFEPFFQVDTSDTRGYEGAGLGLSVAHQLMQSLNGSIEIASTAGEGTIVTIAFPCCVLETLSAEHEKLLRISSDWGSDMALCGEPSEAREAIEAQLKYLGCFPVLATLPQMSTCARITESTLIFLSEPLKDSEFALKNIKSKRIVNASNQNLCGDNTSICFAPMADGLQKFVQVMSAWREKNTSVGVSEAG